MNKPTRVKYIGVEDGAFEAEIVLVFVNENNERIELALAKEDAETLWDELGPQAFEEED
jgi:hypothetical protein